MLAIDTLTKMFDSASLQYTKAKGDGNNVYLRVPIEAQEGAISVCFSDGGKHFLTSSFVFDSEDEGAMTVNSLGSPYAQNDYDAIWKMITEAPEKKGELYEAETEDGKYTGLIFFEPTASVGVAFVFLAKTSKFVSLFGV